MENSTDNTNNGSDGRGTLPQRICIQHHRISCIPCARAEANEYARTTVRPADLIRPSNSQEVSMGEQRQIERPSELYRRATPWRRIAPDGTHGRGCALVRAGLLPIIGEFFYECEVTAIPENGRHTEGETQLGRGFATEASLTRFQTEMADNKRYEVRVSKFGQGEHLRARITSGRFDSIPLNEMPSMAVAVRHLLLYLGSGRDRHSSYRIYRDFSFSPATEDGIGIYQTLFGMTRFPWSPEPHTATTARMINLTFNTTFSAPTLDRGLASWTHFCDSRFKDTWEEIKMRDFEYETYEVEAQGPFTPQDLPPSHTPPGSPPAPASRPSVPPASTPPAPIPPTPIPPADAGSQMAIPVTTTLTSTPAHHSLAPASQDPPNGNSPADGPSRGSSGLSGGPPPRPKRISPGASAPEKLYPSQRDEGSLCGGQTTSEGQHTSGQAGSSTAAVAGTPQGTSQGASLGISMYFEPRAVYGQGYQ